MHRAYSLLTLKSVDDEARVITGIATTPEADRTGDIVEPKGAEFQLPIPLLWQHDSRQPIGEVFAAKVTTEGIEIQARLAKIDEPGTLKNRIDEAWQSIKARLVRGLSIGFKPLEFSQIKETFAIHVQKWMWLELSAVTIPANASANIQTIKQYDEGSFAATGTQGLPGSDNRSAGASASLRVVSSRPTGRSMKKPIADQIKAFELTREEKVTQRDAIMEKAADAGETLDAEQTEQYDGLQSEIRAIDAHLVRLKDLETENKRQAKPVVGDTQYNASTSRNPLPQIQIGDDNREKGIGFARAVIAKMGSFMSMREGNFVSSLDRAKALWPSDQGLHRHLENEMRFKTGVNAATTQAATYAAPLVYADNLASEFIEFLRAMTIVGKFGTNGIPSLRRVPFNVRIPRQTSGMSAGWVGEGAAKLVTSAALDTVTLTYTKVAAIAVITQELARFSSPSAEAWVRDELARAVVARIDSDFIDPAITASSYVRPASITNGLTALSSAGTSADNVRTDIQNLLEQYILNNLDTSDLVLIMPNTLAMVLSILVNTLGQREFPNISINGGNLLGIPVIASQYAASGAQFGNMVIAVKANDVALADDGRVTVDVSSEASLQMDDASTQSSASATGTSVVSMFQTNSLAVRAEREITWTKLRSTAVVYMDDVNWGAIGSPF